MEKLRYTTETDADRKLRVTEVGGKRYAYERWTDGLYTVFLIDSVSGDGYFRLDTLVMDLPGAWAAKEVIAALAAGVSADALNVHAPGHMRPHVGGGGWGGHPRVYRTKAKCRTCGELGSKHSDTLHMDAARDAAWGHFMEKLREAVAAVAA